MFKEMILLVYAGDFPDEVTEWCEEMEIWTHHECGVYHVSNDGNPFAEWLKTQGYKFKRDTDYIGVIGT